MHTHKLDGRVEAWWNTW